MNKKIGCYIAALFILTGITSCCAYSNNIFEPNENLSSPQTTQYAKVQYDAKEFKYNLDSINNKFTNLNIQSAYDNLANMIQDSEGSDYYLILLADKSAALGFFDLAEIAFSKISDSEISRLDSENTIKLFFPKYKLPQDEIISLAEAFSNIEYNNRCEIAIKDIQNTSSDIKSNDYANYLLALAYMKMNKNEESINYIQKALDINPENLNYKILQSQIYGASKKNKKAIKIVKETRKKTNIGYYPIQQQICSNEEYVKYQTEKQPWLKDYHLGYYYYLKDDNTKALRVLQSAISKNNSRNALLYSLMSRIYIKNGDFDRANTVATKAYNYNIDNINTLLTLGDIAYENNKYKQAIKYYKKASKSRAAVTEAKLKLADTYAKLNNTKNSVSICEKLTKTDNTAYKAFYYIALNNPSYELSYLKKSVAINPNFKDGWIDLSRVMIENGNLDMAKKYLENAYYIDGNDYRYYYYQSLLIKKTEELNRLEK